MVRQMGYQGMKVRGQGDTEKSKRHLNGAGMYV